MKACPNCGAEYADEVRFCTSCGTTLSAAATNATPPVSSAKGLNFDFSGSTPVVAAPKKTYSYKVLTQKDKWFSGKFDPSMLESALNAYAQQGWRVIGCATADIPGFGTTRQEFITILEREH